MKLTIYLPDELHERAVRTGLVPSPGIRKGPREGISLSGLLRDALEAEVLKAERRIHQERLAAHTH